MTRNILFLSSNGSSISSSVGPLKKANASLTEVKSIERAQLELQTHDYDIFVSRCEVFDEAQSGVLQFARNHYPPVTTVIAPKFGSIEDAVRAIRMGASDVLVRENIDADFFKGILENTAHDRSPALPSNGTQAANPEGTTLIGNSKAICDVRSAIGLVAKSQAAVLITGESGTGKEIVARRIYMQSDRNTKPFVAINCAAFPKELIENELFGHEKGAFTGALNKKSGAFELAHEGTLFFDEIAEMSPEVQAKLLRAIEHKSFRRLGGKDEIHVDVRVIAATNKNILTALASGEFREDLYYRFSVIEIVLPPLRERPEDIAPLIDYFSSIYTLKYNRTKQRFSEKAIEVLHQFNWPGNVRELRNTVERAVVTCPDEVIGIEYLSPRITKHQKLGSSFNIAIGSTFKEAERTIVLETLACAHNNKSKAARILGLSRKTLHNKLRLFGASVV
ncbi:MAG TPA: sigma-54 dependent transcriptional regulator [Bacteroidota bacterium]|jgi:DNA-binding NtrC family response regulator|nr:sigma-54 dependent transcriptional regulator [Bacteroidota bacterium]